ncbi:hypothetical protein [Methylomagnum sp.]
MYPSIHILGSSQFSGTDQFFVTLVRALREDGKTILAIDRAGTEAGHLLEQAGVEQVHLPLSGPGDVWSAWRIKRIAGLPDKTTRLTLRKPHGIPKDRFVLFTQSRLVESKGVDVLLRASARTDLGRAGETLLRQQFSREAVVAACLDLYSQLLKERGII